MANLIAKSPADGLLPLEIGGLMLSEDSPAAITAVMPFAGQVKPLSAALKAAHGMAFPGPNRVTGSGEVKAYWSGMDQAFLIGTAPDRSLAPHAALVDQTDAWAVLNIQGAEVEAVLARLTPLDLNPSVFKRGHAARSLLGHMSALIARSGAQSFTILVFRSMAATAVHELALAMKAVAARAELEH